MSWYGIPSITLRAASKLPAVNPTRLPLDVLIGQGRRPPRLESLACVSGNLRSIILFTAISRENPPASQARQACLFTVKNNIIIQGTNTARIVPIGLLSSY
jgi:hypothetical protein